MYYLSVHSGYKIKQDISIVKDPSENQVDGHILIEQQAYIREHVVVDRRERNKMAIP